MVFARAEILVGLEVEFWVYLIVNLKPRRWSSATVKAWHARAASFGACDYLSVFRATDQWLTNLQNYLHD